MYSNLGVASAQTGTLGLLWLLSRYVHGCGCVCVCVCVQYHKISYSLSSTTTYIRKWQCQLSVLNLHRPRLILPPLLQHFPHYKTFLFHPSSNPERITPPVVKLSQVHSSDNSCEGGLKNYLMPGFTSLHWPNNLYCWYHLFLLNMS